MKHRIRLFARRLVPRLRIGRCRLETGVTSYRDPKAKRAFVRDMK